MCVSERTRLTLLLASCIFCFAALGHFFWSAAKQRNRPVAFCTEPVHDFGVAKSGDQVKHSFVIENRGSELLFLDNVRTDCRCSDATLSRRAVPPGSSARLEVALSLKGVRGNIKSRVVLETNDPQEPNLVLGLEGTADYDLLVQPTRIVFAKQDEDAHTQTVEVSSRRKEVLFRVLRTLSDWEHLQTNVETITDGAVYHIHLHLSPVTPSVERPSTVRIAVVTDHATESVITIPVTLLGSSI